MSGSKPTDFNDQMIADGRDSLRNHLKQDFSSHAVKQTQSTAAAQPSGRDISQEDEIPLPDDLPPEFAEVDNDEWRDMFERTRDRGLKASVKNITLILQHDERWQKVIAYCDFSYRILKLTKPPMPHCDAGEWDDSDTAALRVWTSHQYGFTPSHADIADALVVVGRSRRFHPVQDYLNGLHWDGEHRLKTWMLKALGATDNERYLEVIGPCFMIGAVARVMRPGCKMDNVMILEGPQGKGKSTIVEALFGDWFSDAQLMIGDKDAYQVIQGVWGFELAELDSFNKSETTTLKQFFSQRIDRFRPSYGRHAVNFPRQTVFMGTTNQDAYLRDYTGNRRFWPAYCSKLNLQWVRDNRDQLWAEAAQLFKNNIQWWVSEDDLAVVIDAQDARLQRDPWEDKLRAWLPGLTVPHISSATILEDCLGIDGAHMQQMHMNRLAPIMKSLGWETKRIRVSDPFNSKKKIQIRVWFSPDVVDNYDEVPL